MHVILMYQLLKVLVALKV